MRKLQSQSAEGSAWPWSEMRPIWTFLTVVGEIRLRGKVGPQCDLFGPPASPCGLILLKLHVSGGDPACVCIV